MKQYSEEEIAMQISLFETIFDSVRIIDFDDQEDGDNLLDGSSSESEKSFVKLRNISDRWYLVMTTPFLYHEKRKCLEMSKELSDNFLYEITCRNGIFSDPLKNLNSLIMRDSLTNLYNRRYIDYQLPQEIRKVSESMPLSVAMIDIDYFKEVNDKYGHDIGDEALRQFGRLLISSIRTENDWIARYGGEEFLLCLPNTDESGAKAAAERIRRRIEQTPIHIDGKDIKITCSFGLYTLRNEEKKIEEILKATDNKLYQAKSLGRNTIVS